LRDRKRRRATAGILLIGLGVAFFVMERLESVDETIVLLALGGAFLAAYFYRRRYGLLLPGCLLLGFGVGEMLKDQLEALNGELLGLGLGFLAIFFIAWAYQRIARWWPLIPGAAFILLAFEETKWMVESAADYWPLILVLIGAILLLGGFEGRRRDDSGDGRPGSPPAEPS
jgi:hypothetical protein